MTQFRSWGPSAFSYNAHWSEAGLSSGNKQELHGQSYIDDFYYHNAVISSTDGSDQDNREDLSGLIHLRVQEHYH